MNTTRWFLVLDGARYTDVHVFETREEAEHKRKLRAAIALGNMRPPARAIREGRAERWGQPNRITVTRNPTAYAGVVESGRSNPPRPRIPKCPECAGDLVGGACVSVTCGARGP